MSFDPFKIDGPTCISVSGGRTSAYMMRRVLDANGGYSAIADIATFIFANTGREAPATLDFVRELQRQWGVPIVWVEYTVADPGFTQVFHATAHRNGEPYEAMLRKKKYLPNPVSRFCTVELKIKPAERFLLSCGWTEWDNMLGFRADEPSRVAKVRAKPILPDSPNVERLVPLATAGISKADVREFWRTQPFDLALPIDYDGSTIDGNCDGCFLKSPHQLVSAMQRNPQMPVWWIEQEDRHGATFTKDGPSYRQMAAFAAQQRNVFDPEQEAIGDCLCGDDA